MDNHANNKAAGSLGFFRLWRKRSSGVCDDSLDAGTEIAVDPKQVAELARAVAPALAALIVEVRTALHVDVEQARARKEQLWLDTYNHCLRDGYGVEAAIANANTAVNAFTTARAALQGATDK